jgi:polyferredoxin
MREIMREMGRNMTRERSSAKSQLWIGTLSATASLSVLGAAQVWAQESGGRGGLGFVDVLLLPRVWMSVIFSVAGLAILLRSRATKGLRLVFLALVFFVFGVSFLLPLGRFSAGMGVHPSPICIVAKPFLFLDAGRSVPVVFLAILASVVALSTVGNKLFCGWVCPVGSVQEICHRIPLRDGLKRKLPFKVTNPIRIGLFAAAVALAFAGGVGLYDYFNPFDFLHWGFQPLVVLVFAVTLAAGLFFFRPFCYVVCPLGLVTWVLEHAAVTKVKLDKEKCTSCNACVELSPCPSVQSILERKTSRPDCHACGRCIEVCPEHALRFRA